MTDDMDVSGCNLSETREKERRRRREAAASTKLDELQAMLLPLALALARLSARNLVLGTQP